MRKITGTILALLFIASVWQVLSAASDTPLLPPPGKILQNLSDLSGRHPLPHLAATFFRLASGFTLGALTGFSAGFFAGRNRSVDNLTAPLFYAIFPIPKVLLIPLLMILFGTGELSKIILIFIIVFFPSAVSARDSIKEINEEFFISYYSIGGDRWGSVRNIIIPYSLPDILTSLKISAGISCAVLFFIEYYGTEKGMGYYIMDAWLRLDYIDLYSGITVLSLSVFILYVSIDLLEKWLCRWKTL